MEIYVASAGCSASEAALSGFGTESDWRSDTLGTKTYDFNEFEPVSVLMDYALWQGSGQNVDALVYIPMDLSGFSSTDYVYTYWKFGNSDDVVFTSSIN